MGGCDQSHEEGEKEHDEVGWKKFKKVESSPSCNQTTKMMTRSIYFFPKKSGLAIYFIISNKMDETLKL